MLSDELKQEIQGSYTQLLDRKGYRARYCQKRMIADIANTLSGISYDDEGERDAGHHVCVIEAGTGTGKTVAYTLAALPVARALGKRLVVATATVALQEQIVNRDLPDIQAESGLEFSFALAKGRRRYLCLARLDQALQETGALNHSLALYDDEGFIGDENDQALFESMLARFGRGDWDGERDSWAQEIEDRAWMRISTDHVQCTGRQCQHFRNCVFYKARERIHDVDCIVTNHDLVLSDLMMGGGAVLPAPEETIYVFDEAHHLPDKAISHFSSFVQLRSTQAFLEQVPSTLKTLVSAVDEIGPLPGSLSRIEAAVQDLVHAIEMTGVALEPLRAHSEPDGEHRRFRFPGGKVDAELRAQSDNVLGFVTHLQTLLQPVVDVMEDRLADQSDPDRELLENWLPVISAMVSRVEGTAALWRDFRREDPVDRPPTARWVTFREPDDIQVSASPVAVDGTLEELLWSRCFGAVMTSATLAVAGNFERFRRRVGISPDNTFNALASPFRFQEQACLRIPRMKSDPREADSHTEEVAGLLPDILAEDVACLVLFTSFRQMHGVLELLPAEMALIVLMQGDHSRSEIIARHTAAIDAGERSIIFGVASFAEGIDLPGRYCDHVVIVKIPFAVPDDPVGATFSEWIEAQGGNSFQEVMVPDAALRLVQACGRLLRTEEDTGTITILDRRLVKQRYGALLLDALPPFRREIA